MNNQNTARYADIFAALGSEARLEIMRLLFTVHAEGMTVGDIQAQLQIPNSTLSHHLEKLRVEGLVSSRRDKQYLWYSANTEIIEGLLSFLYNGCAIRDRVSTNEAEQIPKSVQNTSTEAGFMFAGFLSSIESLFSSVFDRIVLPRGFERFTEKAIIAIQLAQGESRRLGHQYIGTEQLLLGLISEGTGIAAQVLTSVGVNLDSTRIEVEKHIGHGKGTPSDIPFTLKAKQVLELSLEQAQQRGDDYIGTEHLLLGILCKGEGLAFRVLQDLEVNLQNLEQRILNADAPETTN